jgi:peptidyl-dipeptidase A
VRVGTDTLYPWHYSDVFFQQLPEEGRVSLDHLFQHDGAPELARETFGRWAIDLAGVMSKSDLFPRDLKSQHAFCLDVDRTGEDVRILANVVPGERWVEVMLHESGHAAYDVCIDDQLPYLLRRAAHTFVTESIAILSGRLARDPVWLKSVASLPANEIDSLTAGLHAANSAQSLLFARWGLVMVHFERDLYSDPEADLDARWWELVERFQLVTPPVDRSAPDWASKIHIAAAPVYYQNYLLGEMLASQLRASIEREHGELIGVPEAGEFLKRRIFRSGALLRWDSLIEEATGRPLSAADFAAHVGGA